MKIFFPPIKTYKGKGKDELRGEKNTLKAKESTLTYLILEFLPSTNIEEQVMMTQRIIMVEI